MPLIDDDGRLFGLINVIDLLAIVVAVAFLIAVSTLPIGPYGASEQQVSVTVETEVPPYVTDELEARAVESPTIRSIDVHSTVYDCTEHRRLDRLRVRVVVQAIPRDDGGYRYSGQHLSVGTPIEIDAGRVLFEGTVVEINATATEGSP